jgi:hypothetical protein
VCIEGLLAKREDGVRPFNTSPFCNVEREGENGEIGGVQYSRYGV